MLNNGRELKIDCPSSDEGEKAAEVV